MRTRSAIENCRAGKVSLSIKLRAAQPVSGSSPSRKSSRMPCFPQVLTTPRPSIFSAARTLPWVSASRNSRNTGRASGLCSTSPSAARRTMEDLNDDMRKSIRDSTLCLDEIGSHVQRLQELAWGLCRDGQLKSEVLAFSTVQLNADLQSVEAISDEAKVIDLLLGHWC